MAEKIAEEFKRFKKFLKRLVAVPKAEVEEKLEEFKGRRETSDEPGPSE